MSNNAKVTPPYEPFTLLNTFDPLAFGQVFLGRIDEDPRSVSGQIPVYHIDESEKAIRIPQPLKTNNAGLIVYNGIPANVYTYSRHSMLILDQHGQQVSYEFDDGDSDFGVPASFDFREGGTITSVNQVIFNPKQPGDNRYYFWSGAVPHTVPKGSTPQTNGGIGGGAWLPAEAGGSASNEPLRSQLASTTGGTMVKIANGQTVQQAFDSVTVGAANKVSKTGDTMSGKLVITSSANGLTFNPSPDGQPCYLLGQNAGTNKFYVGKGGADDNIVLHNYVYGSTITLANGYVLFNGDPRSNSAQGAQANSLVRKDYLDGKNWTAADANGDIIAGGWGQIGTYTWSRLEDHSGVDLGGTVTGGSLVPVAMDVGNWDGGRRKGSFTGTWKLLGDNDSGRDMAALYIRIA